MVGTSGTDSTRVSNFLGRVGERVRDARARMGISRRVLSDMSGVSLRYLAQLESGKGNISIGLLLRIADSLNVGIEWLITQNDPWTSELGQLAALLRGASEVQREQVMKVLDPGHFKLRRANKIALIGLRGAGKSSLGRLAAAALKVKFLELDAVIEDTGGMPVSEIFALYGQDGYRLLEGQALEKIAATPQALVLAVAGGIVSKLDSFNFLLQNFHTVWLRAEPQEHMLRVRAQGDERPMTGNPDAMQELRNILASRAKLYARAETQVNTSNSKLEESLEELLQVIARNAFLTD